MPNAICATAGNSLAPAFVPPTMAEEGAAVVVSAAQ